MGGSTVCHGHFDWPPVPVATSWMPYAGQRDTHANADPAYLRLGNYLVLPRNLIGQLVLQKFSPHLDILGL